MENHHEIVYKLLRDKYPSYSKDIDVKRRIYDLSSGQVDVDFPKELYAILSKKRQKSILGYTNPQGTEKLRTSYLNYLLAFFNFWVMLKQTQ